MNNSTERTNFSENNRMDIDDFIVRLGEAASLLLNLLQTSKYYKLQLSSISVVCEVAWFFQHHSDIGLLTSQHAREKATETPLLAKYSDKQHPDRLQLGEPEVNSNIAMAVKRRRGRNASKKIKSYTTHSKTINSRQSNTNNSNALQKSPTNHEIQNVHTGDDCSEEQAIRQSDDSSEHSLILKPDKVSDFQCPYCHKEFIDRRNLKSHLWVHEREKSFQCEVCNKLFLRSHQLTRHKRVHTGEKPYSCTECGKAFADVSNLNTHRRKEHQSHKTVLLKCEQCGEQCQTTKELIAHLTSHEEDLKEKVDEVLKIKEGSIQKIQAPHLRNAWPAKMKLNRNTETFLCQVCGKSLNKRAALLAHMKQHIHKKDFRCEFCNKVFPELQELKIHRREHSGDRPYKCDKCGKGFKSQGTLRSHLGVHSGDKPYSCDVCGRSFSQTSGLNQHKLKHTADEEKTHEGYRTDRQNSCDICGRCYKTKFRLQLHLKSHDSNRDVSCDFCEKKFQTAQDLITHRRSHTKDKYLCRVCEASFKSRSVYYFHTRSHQIDRPYLCSTCGKSFTSSNDLNAHKRRHAAGSIFTKSHEQFICNVCGRIYQMKNSLMIHMKIHQGIFDHPCDFCEKKFKSHAELRHHRRVHTLEKPYVCETCSRHFSRHSTLVNHRRTHSGERPYMCTVCGAAFKLSCTLKKHARTHTREARGWKARSGKAKPVATESAPPLSPQEDQTQLQQLPLLDSSLPLCLSGPASIAMPDFKHKAVSNPEDSAAQTHFLQELKHLPVNIIRVDNSSVFQDGEHELLETRNLTHSVIIQEPAQDQQQTDTDASETAQNLIEMGNVLPNPIQYNTGNNTVTAFYYY